MHQFIIAVLLLSPAAETTAAVSQDDSPTVAEQEAVKVAVDSFDGQESGHENGQSVTGFDASTLTDSNLQIGQSGQPRGQSGQLADQMLAENNRIRAAAGKPPQTLDPRLCQAAQEQANWCASHGYTFASQGNAHEFGNGNVGTRTARYGFHGPVAENMAGNSDDARMAFRQWQESSGHYRNLLANYDRCGFGMATNTRGERLWYAVYGTETFGEAQEKTAVSTNHRGHVPESPALFSSGGRRVFRRASSCPRRNL